jgi:hypothetical protein
MANTDHVRRITAMLNTNGCTPAEAQGRLAKARQIAEREGLLPQFPQLRTPEEKAAAKAANAQAKAKAAAAGHSAKAHRPASAPSFNGFDFVVVNGVQVDLANLSGAGLEVLAALLRQQQQEQSVRGYKQQRQQAYNNDLEAYLRSLDESERSKQAAHFRARQGLWTRLAVAVAALATALIVNRVYGGPVAFVPACGFLMVFCMAATLLFYQNISDDWRTVRRNIDHRRRVAISRYGPRR